MFCCTPELFSRVRGINGSYCDDGLNSGVALLRLGFWGEVSVRP